MGNSSHSDAPERRVLTPVRSLPALRSTTAWVGVAFSVVAVPPLALGTLLLAGAPSAIAAGGGGSAGGALQGEPTVTPGPAPMGQMETPSAGAAAAVPVRTGELVVPADLARQFGSGVSDNGAKLDFSIRF